VEDSRKAGIQPPALEIDMRRRNTEPRRRYIDREELLKLCAVSSPKWSAVWRLLFFTGLRVGELMALRWDDWRRDQHAPSLTVSRALCETDRGCILQSPKSGRSRVIPLCREAELALQDLLKAVRGSRGLPGPEDTPKEHLCFPGKTVPFTRSPVVRIALTAACRRAHLEPFGPHCLRHSFASALAKNGVNLQAVCELLGHANISTTQVYSHLSPDGIRQGVNSLDNPTGTPRQRPILS
ncbi:site-specific integrase, partial [Myxococcota bacterium]|nr:site-specific integrase [Myxococcota bacterium]